MIANGRDLLIIACSARKKHADRAVPAIDLYDGPAYRILRKQLKGTHINPTIWVLSAKHGLIWAEVPIYWYDEQLTEDRVTMLSPDIDSFIKRNASAGSFKTIYIWAGEKYLKTLPPSFLARQNIHIAKGPIGYKLKQLKEWCISWNGNGHKPDIVGKWLPQSSKQKRINNLPPLAYFIPDWDDYLDPKYDFVTDSFSWSATNNRVRQYAHELFGRKTLYDGILISLGHIVMRKGLARNGLKAGHNIVNAKNYLHLKPHHILMGDCGAFSYRRAPLPPFSTDEVINLYNELKVDIGASIDHIPFGEVEDDHGVIRPLNEREVESRIELTIKLAWEFLHLARDKAKFMPMGVVQGRTPEEYASIANNYVKMGYEFVALGGLVPRKNDDILKIVEAATEAIKKSSSGCPTKIRIHLFGVLREGLLPNLKALGVTSFDSGSYLRKAWLRSDKNYLSNSNKWYCAIRVPYSKDPRFQKNATQKGISSLKLQELEKECLRLLKEYEGKRERLSSVLDKVIEYDSILLRTSDTNNLKDKYETTLKEAPWEQCDCPVCKKLGIDVIIFRGFNRNKRRGFHNTRIFYKQLSELRGT